MISGNTIHNKNLSGRRLLIVLCIGLLFAAAVPGISTADSAPLVTVQNGTVSGDIYVGAFQPVPWTTQVQTPGPKLYSQQFAIPAFTGIQWARLYASVYAAGTDDRAGRATIWFDGDNNGVNESTWAEDLAVASANDDTVYSVNDHCNKVYSDYLMWYDVTGVITARDPVAYILTGNVNGSTFDGRLKMFTLVVAYNDGDTDQVRYWVNQGHDYQASGAAGHSTAFDTSPVSPGFTSATLKNVALSNRDALYAFNTGIITGADPVLPYNYFESNYWNVTEDVSAGSASTFEYTNNGGSFKTTLATLMVRSPEPVTQADLEVTAITPNSGCGNEFFAHEPNTVNATVRNKGPDAAGSFIVRFIVDGSETLVPVDGLAAGSTVQVQAPDTRLLDMDDTVTVNVTADPECTITDPDRTNNFLLVTKTVYNNGYKGKRWTGGDDIDTRAAFDGRYTLQVSTGNSQYAGAPWSTYTVSWSGSDLPVPAGSTVVNARLYQGYTFDQTSGGVPDWTTLFNGVTLTPEMVYTDRKGYGSYNYPSGLYQYNVTELFDISGNSLVITPGSGNNNGLYGSYLVLVCEDPAANESRILINDGCDMLYAGASRSVSSTEATAFAMFEGVETTGLTGARVYTILPSANEADKSLFLFNGQEYGDFSSGYLGGPQISISEFDVMDALIAGENEAGMQSLISGTSGDNMVAMNAIIVLEYASEQPDLQVTEITPNANEVFALEANEISAVIRNNGPGDAGAFDVEVLVNNVSMGTVGVPGLAAGNTTAVTVNDPAFRAAGDLVNITVLADPGHTIVEADEANNRLSISKNVVYNGYKGKRWTGGDDIITTRSFEGNYDVLYSCGDSVYTGANWQEQVVQWTSADLPIPAGSVIADARLYQAYSYNKMASNPAFSMSFNGNTVTPDTTYMDRKSFGSYDYPYGLSVYDVTGQFNTSGNSVIITPETGNNYGIYGIYLVVVYENPAAGEKQIFVNDGFDMLYAKASYAVSSDEATAYAPFSGADTAGMTGSRAIAILAAANEAGKSRFFFNGNEYVGFDPAYLSGPQIGFSEYNVTAAVQPGSNEARFQSYDSGAGGDNMYAMTAVLVIGKAGNPPVAGFTGTPLSGDAPLAVQFTDESTGNSTAWVWDFENDGVIDSIEQNPVHIYGTPGTYSINLTVWNMSGHDSEIKNDYITVTSPGLFFTRDLGSGWSILSTPVLLASSHDTFSTIFDAPSAGNISILLGWDGQQWFIPDASYRLEPLHAVFVKTVSTARASFVPSSTISSPSSRTLPEGVSLIGPAPAYNGVSGFDPMPVDQALVSIYQAPGGRTGYSMVISPALGQPGWAYARGGPLHDVEPFDGYWVVMENTDTLYGFSTTPLA
jgi:PKD repeat protein